MALFANQLRLQDYQKDIQELDNTIFQRDALWTGKAPLKYRPHKLRLMTNQQDRQLEFRWCLWDPTTRVSNLCSNFPFQHE